MSLRIKTVVEKFVEELKEALDADIQDRNMKEREMQSYIEEREREVAEREAAWKAELSRREAEIVRQEVKLKMERENLEKEKSVLMGTASNQDNLDGALEITSETDRSEKPRHHFHSDFITDSLTASEFCLLCFWLVETKARRKIEEMESSGEMVAFPLLITPIETNYRACTIPYRFPSDNPKKPTPTELSWINLFANSIPSFKKRAESDDTVSDAPAKAEKFAQRYTEILEDFKKDPESHGGPPDCIHLCRMRELILREVGFRDIFKKVKEEENAKAITLFKEVVELNDAIEDESKRMENLVRGIFAGNIFDLGSAQLAELFSKDGMSFLASCQNIVPRPWVIDDLDAFISKWSKKPWKKAVIFVDNSGADIVLGILPFARELLRHGTKVVLAANDLPSINDVTYHELLEIISKLKDENGKLLGVDIQNLLIANSGNDLPVIDLASVSQELAYLASDADLVICEGMGRGIETNLYAQFKCDSLKIGMVKHQEVAQFLGGRLYDCVFKFNEVATC
ncbi:unnamed protein product [Lactuca saligna]|uniref:Damage-control phosphatase ARMT1-like metal-binding domain-containing protein n=1 Tax=Lactuca saligna TaxID=75948 RepID=A0AA35Z2T2_LACSI|nr:unnamed protein product [Lactuca saligna]